MPDLVFKKTPDGERNIALENIIIEDDLSSRNYWQELSTFEAPEADDQVNLRSTPQRDLIIKIMCQ